MLVGATGSGKSTLIDGMINYITDVSWDDEFRFTLIDLLDEEKLKRGDQVCDFNIFLVYLYSPPNYI